jgi:hypothetical protein
VAGCWFIIQDKTGTLKVDTKAAGFVMLDVPMGSAVTVGGMAARTDDERLVSASGVRY